MAKLDTTTIEIEVNRELVNTIKYLKERLGSAENLIQSLDKSYDEDQLKLFEEWQRQVEREGDFELLG